VVDVRDERLDKFLASRETDLSRAQIAGLVAGGLVKVDGAIVKSSYRLRGGETVEMEMLPPPPTGVSPQEIPLSVIYEDEDILVIDKPAGMVVHPAPGHRRDTVANALLARLPDIEEVGDEQRPGIVHRLDMDTSGLMVAAKNRRAHRHVSGQIKDRSVLKGYTALAKGNIDPPEGVIKARIGRDNRNRKRMAVVDLGREAETSYRAVESAPGYTLLEVIPKTGRTHQIRVHLSALGYPIVGDALYGGKDPRLERQFLHAHLLGIRLPGTGEYMEFASPLPADLKAFLSQLNMNGAEAGQSIIERS
jgi:23S rRNA pseudouridine1911/1915/1917 synthase